MRFLMWSICCVGLGVGIATLQLNGQTPLQRMEKALHDELRPSKLDLIRDRVSGALDGARDALDPPKRPREHHSSEDREALNKLIARGVTSAH